MVYAELMDQIQKRKKDSISGQMSLFDLSGDQESLKREISFPDIPEYSSQERLAYEKQVLDLYISGHPLDEEAGLLKRNITARLVDFTIDEESDAAGVQDGATVTIGGMVEKKTMRTTRNGSSMMILEVMDLSGSIEVLCFPRETENYRNRLEEGSKVFIRGRVSMGDEAKGKLICGQILFFEDLPQEPYVLFENREAYELENHRLLKLLAGCSCVVTLKQERQLKRLEGLRSAVFSEEIYRALQEAYGKERVALQEKNVKNLWSAGLRSRYEEAAPLPDYYNEQEV